MKYSVVKTAFWLSMMLTAMLLLKVMLPVSYPIPEFIIRPGTKFWDLPGGSHIGYLHLQPKEARKPYPVIFLQGGPGSPVYDRNIQSLAPLADIGYDVYLYDQAGCGASSRLDDISEYTVDRHSSDLSEIIALLGSEKVILIGQSWGAMLACAYMAKNQHKVEKVIFTGPGPILPENPALEKVKAPDSLHLRTPVFNNRDGRKKIYNLRARTTEAVARAFNLRFASDREMDNFSTILNREMGKSTLCNPEEYANNLPRESGYGFYAMVKTVQSFGKTGNIRSGLVGCKVPALIMRGQCDGIAWGYTAEYLHLFSNSNLVVVPDAGHSIGIEQPEEYIRIIREFLASE